MADEDALAAVLTSSGLAQRPGDEVLSDGAGPLPVLDLRPEHKYLAQRLRGSVNVPLEHLLQRLFLLPDRDVRYVLGCA